MLNHLPAAGQAMKTNRITSTPVLLLAAMNFRNHLPIPQWAVKEGMNQKTSPPALVLAAKGFWHHLPVLERAVMADTSKESTETSPPALPLAATSLMEVGFGEARCQQSSLPDWALPMLHNQSSALSVICVWNSGKMTDGKRFSSITRWRTPSVCRNKGMTGVRHALSVGKKFAGPRQRYVSTWDVAQPWGINEPTPTPREWKAFPYPIQWGGLALDWEEEWRGGGKKGCAKPTETCRHDRRKHWQQLTQTPKKNHPPPKKTQMKKKQLLGVSRSKLTRIFFQMGWFNHQLDPWNWYICLHEWLIFMVNL